LVQTLSSPKQNVSNFYHAAYLSVCHPVSVFLSVCLSFCFCPSHLAWLFLSCLFSTSYCCLCLSVFLSCRSFACLSSCPSVYWSVWLSVSLSSGLYLSVTVTLTCFVCWCPAYVCLLSCLSVFQSCRFQGFLDTKQNFVVCPMF